MESWSPKANRSVPAYIQPEFLITPNRSILTGCRILVVVHSTMIAFQSRADIRNSWLTFDGLTESGVGVIFLVGRMRLSGLSDSTRENLENKIKKESQLHGDILQVIVTMAHWQCSNELHSDLLCLKTDEILISCSQVES